MGRDELVPGRMFGTPIHFTRLPNGRVRLFSPGLLTLPIEGDDRNDAVRRGALLMAIAIKDAKLPLLPEYDGPPTRRALLRRPVTPANELSREDEP